MSRLNMTKQGTPSPPSSGQIELFFDTADLKLKQINESGVVTTLIGAVGPTGPAGATGATGNTGAAGTPGATGISAAPNYYAESLSETSSTTTYPSFDTKLTLTCTPEAGDYILQWFAEYTNTSTANSNYFRILQGAATVSIGTCAKFDATYVNNGWISSSGFKKITLPAESVSFYIQFARQANTAYIKNAVLLLRKVNV